MELQLTNFQDYLIDSGKNTQLPFKFPNGFGASVVSTGYGSEKDYMN